MPSLSEWVGDGSLKPGDLHSWMPEQPLLGSAQVNIKVSVALQVMCSPWGGTHHEGSGVPGEPEKLPLDVRRPFTVISPVVLGVHVCEETGPRGLGLNLSGVCYKVVRCWAAWGTQAWNGCK